MNAGDPAAAAATDAVRLSNRCILALALISCLLGCSQKVQSVTSTVTATFDDSGHHPGTAQTTHAAKVTCSDGSGAGGSPVDCLIVSPGYVGEVAIHKTVETTGAGTVLLTCSAQGHCSAVVVQ